MAFGALLAVRSAPRHVLLDCNLLSSSMYTSVVCTLHVCVVEGEDHCLRDTVVKGAEWVQN